MAYYQCQAPLNLYKTAELTDLVTQARRGRYLQCEPPQAAAADPNQAIYVQLWEDNYPGWISASAMVHLTPAIPPQPTRLTGTEIAARLPQVITFTQQAMAQANSYLWGGTVGPNYDCSGLMQTAFAAAGIGLPRDSYQQEAFTDAVSWDALQPGDLVFFGRPDRTTHVGLYLGEGRYIHSSGIDQGRNGIGIDSLTDLSDPVSLTYYRQRRRPGRVVTSYSPEMPLIWL